MGKAACWRAGGPADTDAGRAAATLRPSGGAVGRLLGVCGMPAGVAHRPAAAPTYTAWRMGAPPPARYNSIGGLRHGEYLESPPLRFAEL